jgi:hypothetical protein
MDRNIDASLRLSTHAMIGWPQTRTRGQRISHLSLISASSAGHRDVCHATFGVDIFVALPDGPQRAETSARSNAPFSSNCMELSNHRAAGHTARQKQRLIDALPP